MLGLSAGGTSAGVVGITMRLQTRAARALLAAGAAAEGGRLDAAGIAGATAVGGAMNRSYG